MNASVINAEQASKELGQVSRTLHEAMGELGLTEQQLLSLLMHGAPEHLYPCARHCDDSTCNGKRL
jgi:hypothetical protein